MSHSVMLTQLANSGWTQCSSIAGALAEAGIPVPTEAYLRSAFDTSVWDTVATLSSDLSIAHSWYRTPVCLMCADLKADISAAANLR